jgi:hypothetical protein
MPRYTQDHRYAHYIRIQLDGKDIPACVAADTDEGWVDAYDLDENNRPLCTPWVETIRGREREVLPPRRRYGRVQAFLKPSAPAEASLV